MIEAEKVNHSDVLGDIDTPETVRCNRLKLNELVDHRINMSYLTKQVD